MAGDFPLTLAQRDIYFDQLRRPGNPFYNVGGYLRLGRIDYSKALRAHRNVVRDHEAFGIRIVHSAQGVRQRIAQERSTDLPIVDMSGSASPEKDAGEWVRQLFQKPLSIDNAEVFKAFLLKLSETEHWYVGLAHHLAIDGWGFANWGKAFAACYAEVETPAENLSWRDVSSGDQQYLLGPRYQQDKRYWSAQYESLPDRFFRPRYGLESGERSLRCSFSISASEFDSVKDLARALDVSSAHVILAAIIACLGVGYGQRDIVVGLPVHSRIGAAQKSLIGIFAGVNPIRLIRKDGQSFAEFVRYIAHRQRASFRHRRYPLGDIVRDLGLSGLGGQLYDIGFSYLRVDADLIVEGASSRLVYVSNGHEKTPLMTTVWDGGDEDDVEVKLDCNESVFTAVEVDLLAKRFRHVLKVVLQSPEIELCPADVLPADEREQVLEGFNATTADYPQDALIHELFEAQAAAHPEAEAVVYEDQRLSYGELNARANQVAHYLLAQGVKPDDRVAICVERS
nr:AMP-binding protein [Lysobacter sp.]